MSTPSYTALLRERQDAVRARAALRAREAQIERLLRDHPEPPETAWRICVQHSAGNDVYAVVCGEEEALAMADRLAEARRERMGGGGVHGVSARRIHLTQITRSTRRLVVPE